MNGFTFDGQYDDTQDLRPYFSQVIEVVGRFRDQWTYGFSSEARVPNGTRISAYYGAVKVLLVGVTHASLWDWAKVDEGLARLMSQSWMNTQCTFETEMAYTAAAARYGTMKLAVSRVEAEELQFGTELSRFDGSIYPDDQISKEQAVGAIDRCIKLCRLSPNRKIPALETYLVQEGEVELQYSVEWPDTVSFGDLEVILKHLKINIATRGSGDWHALTGGMFARRLKLGTLALTGTVYERPRQLTNPTPKDQTS